MDLKTRLEAGEACGSCQDREGVCPACGDLPLVRRVHLAACCGDAASRALVSTGDVQRTLGALRPTWEAYDARSPEEFYDQLESWAPVAPVVAALSAAEAAVTAYEGERGSEAILKPREALELARAWLQDPTPVRAQACKEFFDRHFRGSMPSFAVELTRVVIAQDNPDYACEDFLSHAIEVAGKASGQDPNPALKAALIEWALAVL